MKAFWKTFVCLAVLFTAVSYSEEQAPPPAEVEAPAPPQEPAQPMVKLTTDGAIIETPYYTAKINKDGSACTSLVSMATGEELCGGAIFSVWPVPASQYELFIGGQLSVGTTDDGMNYLKVVREPVAQIGKALSFETQYIPSEDGARLTVRRILHNSRDEKIDSWKQIHHILITDGFVHGQWSLSWMSDSGGCTIDIKSVKDDTSSRNLSGIARPWWIAKVGRSLIAAHFDWQSMSHFEVRDGRNVFTWSVHPDIGPSETWTSETVYHILPAAFFDNMTITGVGKGFIGGYSVDEKGAMTWKIFPVVPEQAVLTVEKLFAGSRIGETITNELPVTLKRGKVIEWHLDLKPGDIGRVILNEGGEISDVLLPANVPVESLPGRLSDAFLPPDGASASATQWFSRYYLSAVKAIRPDWIRRFLDARDLIQRLELTPSELKYALLQKAPSLAATSVQHNLIMLSADKGLNEIPKALREEIAGNVDAGAALLLVQPFNNKDLPQDEIILSQYSPIIPLAEPGAAPEIKTGQKWIAVGDNPVTAGIPLNALPFDKLSYVKYGLREGAQVFLKSESGDPIIAGWQKGKGRVIAIAWQTAPGGKSITAYEGDEPAAAWHYWEYLYGLVARSILWATAKEPQVSLSVAVENEANLVPGSMPRFRVDFNSSLDFMFDGVIEVTTRNRFGEQVERSTVPIKVTQGPGFRMLDGLVPFGGGEHSVDARLMQNANVVNVASKFFMVKPTGRITKIDATPVTRLGANRMLVTVNYETPRDSVLSIALVDAFGRLLSYDNRAVTGAGKVETTLGVPTAVTPMARIEAKLLMRDAEAERRFSGDILLPMPEEPAKRFELAVAEFDSWRDESKALAEKMLETGITSVAKPTRSAMMGGLRILPEPVKRQPLNVGADAGFIVWKALLIDEPQVRVVNQSALFAADATPLPAAEALSKAMSDIRGKGLGLLVTGARTESVTGDTGVAFSSPDGAPLEALHTGVFVDGNAKYVFLLGENGGKPKDFVVTLKSAASVYDCRKGEYLGQAAEIRGSIASGEAKLYALLPVQVKAITALPPEIAIERGREVRLDVAASYDKPGAVLRHVYAVRLFYPNGKECTYHSQNLSAPGGVAKIAFQIAHNAPKGTWKLIIRDAASGVETTVPILVQ